jgi:hypothetical protein
LPAPARAALHIDESRSQAVGDGSNTACGSLGAALTGTSGDVASRERVVRANQSGIELFRLNANGTLTALGQHRRDRQPDRQRSRFSEVATLTIVVRAHSSGIDVFDISTRRRRRWLAK